MAKRMAHTDPATGATYPASVWLPLGVYADFAAAEDIDLLGG